MALLSQSPRSTVRVRASGGPSWSRKRRRRQKTVRRAGAVVVLAGLAVAAWMLLPIGSSTPGLVDPLGVAGGEPGDETPGGATGAADRERERERPAETIAASPEPTPEAPVIRMGEPMDDAASRASDLASAFGSSDEEVAAQRPATRGASSPAGAEKKSTGAPALSDPPDESGTAPIASDLRSPPSVKERILRGVTAVEQNDLVEARRLLSEAMLDEACAPADRAVLRERIAALNETLIFSPTIVRDDPLVKRYTVEPGDALSTLVRKAGAKVDWRFVQRINRISDPRRIRVGQTLKIVTGAFHAVIDKSDYRMDVFAQTPSGGGMVYVRSFPVGLGEHGSTPTGDWVVRESSKLVNPRWVNPRTGEAFEADDPENPIGERWIGLEGTDSTTEALSGYGIHGTIEPSSIGQDASMGCVRLLDDDVEIAYEMLTEGASRVSIVD